MNYNKLYYFYEVSNFLNITKAAQYLCISQPSLSKAILDLEEEVGAALFYRKRSMLELTPAGKILQDSCSDFFREMPAALEQIKELKDLEQKTIRFDSMHFSYDYRMMSLLERFKEKYPNYTVVQTTKLERTLINEDLIGHRADIGLKIFTADEIIPAWDYQVLEECHLTLIVPVKHPLAAKEMVTLYDLKDVPMVSMGVDSTSSEYNFINNWFSRCGFTPKYTSGHDRVEAVLSMVQSGLGVAILSDLAPLEYVNGLVSVPLNNAPTIYTGLFWPRGHLPEHVAAFRDEMILEFRKN